MKYLLLLAFTVNLGLSGLIAQQTKTDTLREVIIASRAEKHTPVTFQNLEAKALKAKSNGQEPSFILAQLPSMTNYSDAGGSQGYSYFRLRGIDQSRINITYDGMPLNEPEDQGMFFSNLPDLFGSVSRVQLQRGVGTSKNGVASYAGSVQLFSPDLLQPKSTEIGLGYGSYNRARAFASHQTGLQNGKAFYVRAAQVYTDGYKYDASNNAQSVVMGGGWYGPKSVWKLNVLAGQQRNELAWLGVSADQIALDRRTNGNKNEKDRFAQSFVQLQNYRSLGKTSSITTSAYHSGVRGSYDFNLNHFLGLPSTNELYNYAFRSNLVGVSSNYILNANQFNWVTGVHANAYAREHIGSEVTIGQLYQNRGFKREASAFTKAEYQYGKLLAFADLQYRLVQFAYKGSTSLPTRNWAFLNPKAGLSYRLNPESVLYYSIGSTGREPTRNDMFGGNDDLLADSLGNAIVFITKPEYVLDHELGIRQKWRKVQIDFNLFYLGFRDEIVLNGKFGPNGLALTNRVDQSYRTGAELSLQYQATKTLSLTQSASYQYSRIQEQEIRFSPILSPRFIWNQEVNYQNTSGFTASIRGRYQSAAFLDFANSASLSGYALFGGQLGYQWRRLHLSLNADNLTNTKYYNNGYVDFDGTKKYFVQMPINYFLSVKVQI
jgi:iron complex outermembrane recepter protein